MTKLFLFTSQTYWIGHSFECRTGGPVQKKEGESIVIGMIIDYISVFWICSFATLFVDVMLLFLVFVLQKVL